MSETDNPFPTEQEVRRMELMEIVAAIQKAMDRSGLGQWVMSFGDARAEGLDVGDAIERANKEWGL